MTYHWRRLEAGHIFPGREIEGDERMPKTRSWNAWFLRWHCWQKVAVFRVRAFNGKLSIYAGFSTASGMEYRAEPLTRSDFAVKIGREPCTFFCFYCMSGRETGNKIELSIDLLGIYLQKSEVPKGVEWV
jgi:hypothetical protein